MPWVHSNPQPLDRHASDLPLVYSRSLQRSAQPNCALAIERSNSVWPVDSNGAH